MIYGLLYILCMGFSSVLLEKAGLSFSPSLTLVFGSFLALLYFNLINIRKLKAVYQICWQHKRDTLLINLSVFIIWFSTVYGVVYTGAAVFTFVFFASMGSAGRLAEFVQHRRKWELISLCLILLLILITILFHVEPPLATNKLTGVGLGILGGIVGYYYLRLSGRFMKQADVSATQVLAIRFYLAVILGYFFIPPEAISDLTLSNLGLILIIICFNLIIPLYFSQKAVEKAGAELTAVLISCTPLVTAVIETLILQKAPHYDFAIYLVYVLIVAIPYIQRLRKKAEK